MPAELQAAKEGDTGGDRQAVFQASAERRSRGGSRGSWFRAQGHVLRRPRRGASLRSRSRRERRVVPIRHRQRVLALVAGAQEPPAIPSFAVRVRAPPVPPRGRTVDHPEHSMQHEQRPSPTARSRPHTFAMRRSGVRIPAAPLTTRDQPLRGSVPCSSGHGPGPLHGRFRSRRYREAMVLGADACRAGWVGLLLTSSTRGRGMRRVHLRLPGRRRRDARPARAGRRRFAGRVARWLAPSGRRAGPGRTGSAALLGSAID